MEVGRESADKGACARGCGGVEVGGREEAVGGLGCGHGFGVFLKDKMVSSYNKVTTLIVIWWNAKSSRKKLIDFKVQGG